MKVLFLGGNGNISWWCVQRALERGYEVHELNRGMTRATRRAVQPSVRQILADIRDAGAVAKAIGNEMFDVVCDFICFNGEQAERAVQLFQGRTSQYVFISSEAVYQRKSEHLPFRENAPQYPPDVADAYISGKVQAEQVFRTFHEKTGFPVTIVRPGYTYDTILQVPVGQNDFTAPRKFLAGYPLLMPGDGENLCAPLHARDFAEAFVDLLGHPAAIGEDYHIAGEMLITGNEMAECILGALGVHPGNILHIPREEALRIVAFYSETVNRQHMWHYLFSNEKIKSVATRWRQKTAFRDGIRETVAWLMESDIRRRINPACDEALDKLYRIYGSEGKAK